MNNFNNRRIHKWNDELRVESLDIWNESVQLFNPIWAATENFPGNLNVDLRSEITQNSTAITDKIAKSSMCHSRAVFESELKQAVDHVHKVMAQLYIAKQWNCLSGSYYKHLFEQGRELVNKLCLFGGFEYKSCEVA